MRRDSVLSSIRLFLAPTRASEQNFFHLWCSKKLLYFFFFFFLYIHFTCSTIQTSRWATSMDSTMSSSSWVAQFSTQCHFFFLGQSLSFQVSTENVGLGYFITDWPTGWQSMCFSMGWSLLRSQHSGSTLNIHESWCTSHSVRHNVLVWKSSPCVGCMQLKLVLTGRCNKTTTITTYNPLIHSLKKKKTNLWAFSCTPNSSGKEWQNWQWCSFSDWRQFALLSLSDPLVKLAVKKKNWYSADCVEKHFLQKKKKKLSACMTMYTGLDHTH